jgi:LuxR family maltose regulon positive regulatory protein
MTTGPYVPEHAVARPGVLRQLDEALHRPVTLVIAPAGAGKSVVLSQWLRTLDIDTLWLDITDADNDAEYFGSHLRRSITPTSPGVSDLAKTLALAGPALGRHLAEDVEAMLTDAPPCVIVLDDLHHLHNISLLEDLHTVLSRLPPTVHVVLSGRTDPPILGARPAARRDRRAASVRTRAQRPGIQPPAACRFRCAPRRSQHRGPGSAH